MDVEFMNAKFDQLLERDILPYFNDNIKGIPIDEITAKMKSLFRDSVGEKIFENLTEFENRVHDAFVLFEEWLVAEKKIDKQEGSELCGPMHDQLFMMAEDFGAQEYQSEARIIPFTKR